MSCSRRRTFCAATPTTASTSPPSDVAEFGDVNGLITVGQVQVVQRLQAELDEARRVFAEVQTEIDQYKRDVIGPNYRPIRPGGNPEPPGA